jgi:hypothetical protein
LYVPIATPPPGNSQTLRVIGSPPPAGVRLNSSTSALSGVIDADAVLLDRVGRVDRWAALGGST